MTGPWVVKSGEVLAVEERFARLLADRRGVLSAAEAEALFAASGAAVRSRSVGRAERIAVLSIRGPISQDFDFWGFGTSTQQLRAEAVAAAADKGVAALVLDVNSPGGSVYGVAEAAAAIREAAARKPVVASVNGMAASAAYWLASGADEIVSSPSSELGSVGVFAVHFDESRALDQAGVTPTLIASDPTKTFGNPFEPLPAAARAEIEKAVGRYYDMFARDVATGRGVPEARVRQGWRALVYGSEEAVRLGLADRVGTLDVAIRRARDLAEARPGVPATLAANRAHVLAHTPDRLARLKLRAAWADEDARLPRARPMRAPAPDYAEAEREAALARQRVLS